MNSLGSVALLALSLAVAGCATRSAPHPAATAPGADAKAAESRVVLLTTLAGTSWKVVELDGSPVTAPAIGWAEQSLEFDSDGLRATGNGGVNRFGGRYVEEGKALSFGPLAMTRRGGPVAQMEAEARYTGVLSRVVEWRQDGERLVLIGPGAARVAVLERVVVPKAK